MPRVSGGSLLPALAALALLVAGCGDDLSGPQPGSGAMPEFSLSDVNPASATYEHAVSPRSYTDGISGWYFGHATWSYCRAQFGLLDSMQVEIDAAHPAKQVRLLGVNAVGAEAGNAAACAGRTLPWLQDVPGQQVWQSWAANYRDVVILGPGNVKLTVYNLSAHNLADTASFNGLKRILLAAAK